MTHRTDTAVEPDPGIALIFERLMVIEAQTAELKRVAEQHWRDEERRFRLIDQFLSPAMNLEGLLAQLGDAGRTQNQMLGELRESVERELRAMRSAVRLAIGAAEIEVEAHTRGN
jgi:hypothetical protein